MSIDISEFNYLPEVEYDKFRKAVLSNNWSALYSEIIKGQFERIGLDRLLLIMDDIRRRYGRTNGFSLLDVGCNNGFFSKGFAAFGNKVDSIDNYIINIQNLYSPFTLRNEQQEEPVCYEAIDIRDYLQNYSHKTWDFVFLLSVAHQWEFGYAHSGEGKFSEKEIRETLQRILSRTNKAIYYECPYDEPGFEFNYGTKFIYKYLDNLLDYSIKHVNFTTGSNGYMRRLLRIERNVI